MNIFNNSIFNRHFINTLPPANGNSHMPEIPHKGVSNEESFTPSDETAGMIRQRRSKNTPIKDNKETPSTNNRKPFDEAETSGIRPENPGNRKNPDSRENTQNPFSESIVDSLPLSKTLSQAVNQHNLNDNGLSPKVAIGANGTLMMMKESPPAGSLKNDASPSLERKTLDTSVNPEIRKSFDKYLKDNQADYPRLSPEKYEAVSEATRKYNCIANSVRNEDEVILPKVTTDEYDKFYAKHGFKPLDFLDYSLQEGIEKVVLYGFKPSDGQPYDKIRNALASEGENYEKVPLCFHAVVQEKDGTFSSKMGAHERIRVLNPDDLGGGLYGNPVRVYVRAR